MRSCPIGQRIEIRVTRDRFPEQNASHIELLESSDHQGRAQFDAILVPTNRPVGSLSACITLARQTAIPLIVVCSKRVNKRQVIEAAARESVEVFAVDLPEYPANPLVGTSFGTSTDEDLLAASSGKTRDLSTKRNLGLVIAKMLGWRRLMFLDDDIYGISKEDVEALAAALNNHNVSVLIPKYYPDNSVACHAFRLGGGEQDTFASAGGMGVRCDWADLPFFPNVYNEDWFFFSREAATRRIAVVGESRQRKYDPYQDPNRAVKEEFGDLLAEGLYARLDARLGISDVDEAYWTAFKESRRDFLRRVAESLQRHPDRDLDGGNGPQVRAAQVSIRAAQGQLERIDSGLCQKFIKLWQADLVEWGRYLTELPHFESVRGALHYLRLEYSVTPSAQ
jgi:glycosyltransferase involved in cell wall biosynthesis